MRSRVGFIALFAAEIVSALGNRMSIVAVPWLVLVITGSPVKMGLVAVGQLVPYLLAGVLATPLADRFGLRAASIATDVGSALAMAAIAAMPGIGFAAILGLVAVAGALRGVGDRAKHVLLRPMAEATGARMVRVTAAYEGLVRGATLVGAPLGGLLIYWFGAQGAIWVDAVSFLACAAIVAVLVRPPAGPDVAPVSEPYLQALRGGARYLRHDRVLLGLLMMVFFANVFAQASTAVFVPIWVSDVVGSPALLGTLLGAFAAGAVLGSILFTALAPALPQRATFVIALAAGGSPQLLVLLSHNLPLVLAVTFCCGVAMASLNPILGALQYERIPTELQTRVFGLATAICYAGLPIGGALGGLAVAALGLDPAILLGGCLYLALTLVPLFRLRSRDPAPTGQLEQPSTTP